MEEKEEYIEVIGARENNLKNIDIKIPRNKLVVITGMSGSGKSSLAFDTIYAEGQRRYIETFSAYARQFLGGFERPDVDKITGLSPVIAIEQKTISKNPRSTVGTITEVYDFLRLLYARVSDAISYKTGELMVRYTDDQITDLILEEFKDQKLLVLAPIVNGRKGHYRELFEQIQKEGYLRARIDGEIVELTKGMRLDRYVVHDIEVVIDRLKVQSKDKQRILKSVQNALEKGKGRIVVLNPDSGEIKYMSRHLMCPTSGISYPEPEPNLFSFNSPYGACPHCNGLGEIAEIDEKKIIPDSKKNISQGAIKPLGELKNNWIFTQVEALLKKHNYSLKTPIKDIDEQIISSILYGSDEMLNVSPSNGVDYQVKFEGVIIFMERQVEDKSSAVIKRWASSFMNKKPCPDCNGARLKKEALFFKIKEKNIAEIAQMDLAQLAKWFNNIEDDLGGRKKIPID